VTLFGTAPSLYRRHVGVGRSFRRGALGRALVAVAVVLLSVPIAASTVEGGTAPGVTVTSPNQCLGPGAVLTFDSRFFASPASGGQNFVTVLAGGTKSIGTLPLVPVASGPFVDFNVLGSLPLPAGTGGVFSWTLRQVFTSSSGGQSNIDHVGFFDTTRWTCTPNLAANTTCLPPTGGSLTLTGQVNRANEQIDVGFDVDVTQSAQPIANIIQQVGNTGPNGEINVTFNTPALAPGQHTFFVGRGSFDGPFFWSADDQSVQRNGVFPADQIVSVPITVPCPAALFYARRLQLRLRERGLPVGAVTFNPVNVGNIAVPDHRCGHQ
jgi:hypothetical protein